MLASHPESPRRLAQRARRRAIFQAWSQNPNFNAIAREFDLTSGRVRQILWKAIVSDGCRSDQACAWMVQAAADGHWLRRYEAGFSNPASVS